MRVLIVGCGYVGLPLGKELARLGHEVFGLRRSVLAEAELKAAGITPLHADITQPETLAKLPRDFDWVVNCAASGGGGADDYRKVYLEGNRNLIAHFMGDAFLPLLPKGGEGRGEEAKVYSNQIPSPQPSPSLGGAREPDIGPRLKKFVYTSSTSVYAQNDGAVVTEDSPTEPEADTAKVLVETEKLLLSAALSFPLDPKMVGRAPHQMPSSLPLLPIGSADSADAEREKRSPLAGEPKPADCSTAIKSSENPRRLSPLPAGEGQGEGESVGIQPAMDGSRGRSPHPFLAVILRVAGIYGPGRGYAFKQFLRGEARIEGDGARVMNMIHRDDLIGVIIAALERGEAGQIYNAADNEPVSQRDFYGWLAGELKRPLPPQIPADAEAWRKRGVTNKRVSNAKLRAELKYEFKFPDFRAGYAPEVARVKAEN